MKIYLPDHIRHINSVPMLAVFLGREVWEAGCGGQTSIGEPRSVGILQSMDDEFFFRTSGERVRRSMLDLNVLPNEYNNWYLCESQTQAQTLNEYLKSQWTEEHEEFRLNHMRG